MSPASIKPTPPSRVEHIYVLYGSQTGNSEQAAQEMCAQVPTKLSPEAIAQWTRSEGTNVTVTASHMQLDDFLELEQCKWTRLIVIITSSYGVGQAPLGGYRFRDLCDAWLDDQQQPSKSGSPSVKKPPLLLQGVKYALCGLGDSKYTTYFRNPTIIDQALQSQGAQRVGELGKADASGTGENVQAKVIERWINGIWTHLAQVVIQEPLSMEQLQRMQNETIELCCQINPEFPRPNQKAAVLRGNVLISILVALLAAAFSYYSYLEKFSS